MISKEEKGLKGLLTGIARILIIGSTVSFVAAYTLGTVASICVFTLTMFSATAWTIFEFFCEDGRMYSKDIDAEAGKIRNEVEGLKWAYIIAFMLMIDTVIAWIVSAILGIGI
jgi:hypothetical protein